MDLLPHRRLQNVQMVAKMTQWSLTVVSRDHHIPSYKKVSSHTCKGNMLRIVHCIEMYKFTVSMLCRNVQCQHAIQATRLVSQAFCTRRSKSCCLWVFFTPPGQKNLSVFFFFFIFGKLSQKTFSHHTTVFTGCVELLMINKQKFMSVFRYLQFCVIDDKRSKALESNFANGLLI